MAFPHRRIYDIGLFAVLLLLAVVIWRGWKKEDPDTSEIRSRPVLRREEQVEPTEEAKGERTKPYESVNLLKLIDPLTDAIAGTWVFDGESLLTSAIAWGRLEIPCIPPDEYDLNLVVVKEKGVDSFNMGLSNGVRQLMVVLDGNGAKQSGLDLVKGKGFSENPTTFTETIFEIGQRHAIAYSVRKGGITVSVDGRTIIDWQGNLSDVVGVLPPWFVSHKQALFIGSFATQFRIQEMTLKPISGSCKLLR